MVERIHAQRGAMRLMRDRRRAEPIGGSSQVQYLDRLFTLVDRLDPGLPSESRALEVLESARWPSQVTCPDCGSRHLILLGGSRNSGKGRRYCQDCRCQFSPYSGTPLAGEKWPPRYLVAALRLATEFRGPMLADRISELEGAPKAGADRLALKVQHLFESRHPDAGSSRSGRSARALQVAAVILIALACGGVALIANRSGSEPLYAKWSSNGRKIEWATDRLPGESRASWTQRHSFKLSQALNAYPPDKASSDSNGNSK